MKKRKYFPSSFLIIIGMMLAFIVASWIGQAVDSTKITGVGFLDVFTSIWHGFKEKADVILFIFAIGGTLGVMTKIKAIDAGIGALVNKLGDKVWLLIPALMFVFGLGGTSYGMWEETIAFIPVLVPVFKKAGYGAFTAILVILVGAGVGCLASTVNPFAVGAAVNAINDVENVTAGFTAGTMQGTRWLSFFAFEIVAIVLVTWTTTRYKKAHVNNFTTDAQAKAAAKGNPFIAFFTRARVVEGIDNKLIDSRFKEVENIKFTVKRKISLALFILTFLLMIIMYLPWGDWLNLDSSVENFKNWMFWLSYHKLDDAGNNVIFGFAPIGWWYFVSVAGLFLISTVIIFAINFKEFTPAEVTIPTEKTKFSALKFIILLLLGVVPGIIYLFVKGGSPKEGFPAVKEAFQEFPAEIKGMFKRNGKDSYQGPTTLENNETVFINSYMDGVKDMVSVCMIIATAAGLGKVLDTTGFGKIIAESAAKGLNSLLAYGLVVFFVSLLLSMLVPSTSGFAAAFMPIFGGIAVQSFSAEQQQTALAIAMLGFLFANGLANFVTPTSAALMGYTSYAGVPYNVWIKQTWKMTLSFFVLSFMIILIVSAMANGGAKLF